MEKMEANKRWFITCDYCSYKKIFESSDEGPLVQNRPKDITGMVEIKTSPVPGGTPQLDPHTNKTIVKPEKPQPKKTKCPKCGRGVIIKKLPDVYVNMYKEIDENEKKSRVDAEKAQRLKDGQPIKRDKDPTFLG